MENNKNNPLTLEQKAVLRYMADQNIGATPINGIWYFPQMIRDDAGIADILYSRFFAEVK